PAELFFPGVRVRRGSNVLAFGKLHVSPAALAFANLVERHRLEPGTEALPGIVVKLRDLLDQDREDLLDQVAGVRLLQTEPPRPGKNDRSVQADETRPGVRIVALLQALHKADRGRFHGQSEQPWVTPDQVLPVCGITHGFLPVYQQ